jgi:hypothetical protein
VFVDGIFFILVFSSCSQRVPACVPNDVSQFPNVFPRAPRIHPTSLPQSSPFSPSPVYRGPNENAFYFHTETSILVVLIQMLIKKSHNFNCNLHGTLVASTHLSNTYHSTFAAYGS